MYMTISLNQNQNQKKEIKVFTLTRLFSKKITTTNIYGFFFSYKSVIDVLKKKAEDINELYYDYVVIEDWEEGPYYIPELEEWYKYNPDLKIYEKTQSLDPQVICWAL